MIVTLFYIGRDRCHLGLCKYILVVFEIWEGEESATVVQTSRKKVTTSMSGALFRDTCYLLLFCFGCFFFGFFGGFVSAWLLYGWKDGCNCVEMLPKQLLIPLSHNTCPWFWKLTAKMYSFRYSKNWISHAWFSVCTFAPIFLSFVMQEQVFQFDPKGKKFPSIKLSVPFHRSIKHPIAGQSFSSQMLDS